MKKEYLGIYSDSSSYGIDNICFDTNSDFLSNEEYEIMGTIEELERKETSKKFLHIFESFTNDYDITIYKYLTSKILK